MPANRSNRRRAYYSIVKWLSCKQNVYKIFFTLKSLRIFTIPSNRKEENVLSTEIDLNRWTLKQMRSSERKICSARWRLLQIVEQQPVGENPKYAVMNAANKPLHYVYHCRHWKRQNLSESYICLRTHWQMELIKHYQNHRHNGAFCDKKSHQTKNSLTANNNIWYN